MRILFCNNFLEPGKVDPDFEREQIAAKAAGFSTALLSFEALESGDMRDCLRRIKPFEQEETALYRGWMLRPEQYRDLFGALLKRNVRLLTSPEAYQHCHYLPESYNRIASVTAESTWQKPGEELNHDNIQALLAPFGKSAVVVKDYVKSEKHYWNEACFIPDASDVSEATSVINRFLELRGTSLNVGLVVRKFEELQFLTHHSASGMPLTKEYRLFFLKGKLMATYPYWSEGEYDTEAPNTAVFERLAQNIESPFFTMDIAQKTSGEWIIMELGDGQVSGLPDETNNSSFYPFLKELM